MARMRGRRGKVTRRREQPIAAAAPDDQGLVWEVPPARVRIRWAPVIESLKNRRGEWARVAMAPNNHGAHATAQMLRRDYGCEALVDGRDVYARWSA